MSSNSERITASLKEEVFQRANYCCEYCRSQGAYCPDSLTVDHIQPRQAGGETTLNNLACACFGCNSRKHKKTSHRDPETDRKVRIFNPRQQIWSEHFAWSDDFTIIQGKTACGRATIDALALNRSGVVNLRRLLITVGLHPPE